MTTAPLDAIQELAKKLIADADELKAVRALEVHRDHELYLENRIDHLLVSLEVWNKKMIKEGE